MQLSHGLLFALASLQGSFTHASQNCCSLWTLTILSKPHPSTISTAYGGASPASFSTQHAVSSQALFWWASTCKSRSKVWSASLSGASVALSYSSSLWLSSAGLNTTQSLSCLELVALRWENFHPHSLMKSEDSQSMMERAAQSLLNPIRTRLSSMLSMKKLRRWLSQPRFMLNWLSTENLSRTSYFGCSKYSESFHILLQL